MTANAPVTPATGRLITFVGGDGAGKSTLAARLHRALNDAGHEAILVGKHSTDVPMDTELSAHLDRLNELVYRRGSRVAKACGDHYWLLALASWYTLQDRLVIRPALAGTLPLARAADALASARTAALVDPEGESLAKCLSEIEARGPLPIAAE